MKARGTGPGRAVARLGRLALVDVFARDRLGLGEVPRGARERAGADCRDAMAGA
jgi:hypothetical protein